MNEEQLEVLNAYLDDLEDGSELARALIIDFVNEMLDGAKVQANADD